MHFNYTTSLFDYSVMIANSNDHSFPGSYIDVHLFNNQYDKNPIIKRIEIISATFIKIDGEYLKIKREPILVKIQCPNNDYIESKNSAYLVWEDEQRN